MKLIVNDEEVTLEDKRLTLLMHNGEANIRAVNDATAVIDPDFTAWVAKRLIKNDEWAALRDSAEFRRLWALVWKDVLPPEKLENGNAAMQHTAGLIVAVVGAIRANKAILIKMPETYLHPAQQLGLADLVLELTKEESQ